MHVSSACPHHSGVTRDLSLPVLNAAWAAKVTRFRAFISQAGRGHSPRPVPIPSFGGWHLEEHRAVLSIASGIASHCDGRVDRARSILFQRHAAVLATNNSSRLLSGCVAILQNALNAVNTA